jgi:uncharacterized protein (DUF302 family)
MDDHGLTTIPSAFSVRETIDRLERIVTSKGLRVFARIDHADGAAQVGLALRPTDLLLFGHPRGGTPLMQDQQTSGIDLPVKALAWEDAEGGVWLTYNDASWLAQRHQLGAGSSAAVATINSGQTAVILAATSAAPLDAAEQ